MREDELIFGWSSAVDKVVRGERFRRPLLVLGPTPEILREHGLNSGSLAMMVAKLATCRREHPEVPLSVWRDLPALIANPLAVFPSARRDGSLVCLLVVQDRDGNPIIVVTTSGQGQMNVILSVYGKHDGMAWVAREIARAKTEDYKVFEKMGFAASLPQPPAAEAASSSHGLIPSDGTTKPRRKLLSLREKST